MHEWMMTCTGNSAFILLLSNLLPQSEDRAKDLELQKLESIRTICFTINQ